MTQVTVTGALHLPLNTLALRRGGLVKAVMMRANVLAGELDRPVVIEVLAFQPRLEEDVAELVAGGFLDERVHVRSVLRSLDPALGPATGDPFVGCVHAEPSPTTTGRPGRPPVPPNHDPRAVALAGPPSAGRLLHRARPRVPTREGERLKYVDVLDARGARITREEIGTGDQVVRMQHFRPGDRQPVQQRWLGRDGRAFLTVWQQPDSPDWQSGCVFVDGEVRTFGTMAELYDLAFGRLLGSEIDPVLFSEFREGLPNVPDGLDPVVIGVRHPSLRRVAVLHSNHALQGQQRMPKRSSPKFAALLTGLRQWDRLVVATEHQRDEIAEQYGEADRIVAIPHFGPPAAPSMTDDYDPHRFVLVARIHKKKRVDEAIEAFRLVADADPDARLAVFGFGYGDALEREITALVERHGLDERVSFAGFASDIGAIYRGACASIQTSQSEGFGMALVESLAHGVPVVAYDVAYGARDVIRDGVDGFVVPWGDRDALAERMLLLSRDGELRRRMAAAAPDGAARFSRERYAADWSRLLAGLPGRVDARIDNSALVLHSDAPGEAVLLRPRVGPDVSAPLVDGAARVPLPDAPVNCIVDVYYVSEGELVRTPCAGPGPSDDPRWRAYVTEHGNLSLRRVKPPAAATGDGTPVSAAAQLRRKVERLRHRFPRSAQPTGASRDA